MKSRILVAILVLLLLTILVTRKDDRIVDSLLSIVNPIKQIYSNITQEVEDKSQSYLYQKEHIQELSRENKILRKHLLEQKHYIQQVKDLYKKIPSLERTPPQSVELVQTISYVKLNSFSQIILTKPKSLESQEGVLFGLIQEDVVAGVAQIHNNNLYGSFTSNSKCRFSVFVGKNRAPGVAIGMNTQTMVVKFIPKWSDIKVGDEVITSGIDNIFFANIPVGVVKKIDILSSYKVAYIKSYADILHPDYFYLITDASATFVSDYDSNQSNIHNRRVKVMTVESNQTKDSNYSQVVVDENIISSIPSLLIDEPQKIMQTREDEVNVTQLEIPKEPFVAPLKRPRPKARPKPKPKREKPKTKKRVYKVQPKVENLEMF
jgi:rod shape-determining protein MreC